MKRLKKSLKALVCLESVTIAVRIPSETNKQELVKIMSLGDSITASPLQEANITDTDFVGSLLLIRIRQRERGPQKALLKVSFFYGLKESKARYCHDASRHE
ncbi:hypothetical protein PAAG_12371 [Paracoccidioides lutzii Pb01]|uniref:Uncharacterized protein n=1 Tax=Paracoccidioides lutzii (strain ATCC MYA-826 / Pb01) TaxID=502779 RepID=A0A0A2VJ53_PARBA|nr:hypothetical protein PAAG_12371 [Paracoccidioides lutzii Pb01]KGQ00944.1 hypothetical protein PAAG_12371 [Paracoccidioides lutzii Pb01]